MNRWKGVGFLLIAVVVMQTALGAKHVEAKRSASFSSGNQAAAVNFDNECGGSLNFDYVITDDFGLTDDTLDIGVKLATINGLPVNSSPNHFTVSRLDPVGGAKIARSGGSNNFRSPKYYSVYYESYDVVIPWSSFLPEDFLPQPGDMLEIEFFDPSLAPSAPDYRRYDVGDARYLACFRTVNETTVLTSSNPATWDYFGASTDIVGNTAIVGAEYGNYALVMAYDGRDGSWSETSRLTVNEDGLFGSAVSIDDNTAIVGARAHNNYLGAAYIFERNESGLWSEVKKLTASDGAESDQFGSSVSIGGNVVIVGAPVDNNNVGAAYIFERNESGLWSEVKKLTASDGSEDHFFGGSVAISNGTAVVGASSNGAGAVYIFEQNENGSWSESEDQLLKASDGTISEKFGSSVSISGNSMIIGASNHVFDGLSVGAAYIFDQGGDGKWREVAKLLARDSEDEDRFGSNVSMSGNQVIVAATWDDDRGSRSGSAYVFTRGEDNFWFETAKIAASNGVEDDFFGSAVAISENFVVVGAPSTDDEDKDVTLSGTAYILNLRTLNNEPPIAQDDMATANQDSVLTGASVLANDSDPDGDPLSVDPTPAAAPLNGALLLNVDGTFVYTPTLGFVSNDSFDYVVTDGNGGSDRARVTIAVQKKNSPPLAVDDTATTMQDTVLNGASVLANDMDPDGDSLAVNSTPVSGMSHGALQLYVDGTYDYTPAAGFVGTTSFTYEVLDGNGARDTAEVTVIVTAMPAVSVSSSYLPLILKPLPESPPDETPQDLIAQAQEIVSGATNSGQVNAATPNVVYKIHVEANTRLTAQLTGSGGDADIYLFPPSTTNIYEDPVADYSVNENSEELIQGTILTTGDWYLVVSLYADTVDYQLTVTLEKVAQSAMNERPPTSQAWLPVGAKQADQPPRILKR